MSEAQTEDIKRDDLALYEFYSCPYCARVRSVMNELDLDIERRDILQNPQYRDELIKGGGRKTVPCLRIDHPNGDTEWMYESGQIASFLRRQFG